MAELALELTDHARARCQQRGITTELLQTVLDEADRWTPVGSGVFAGTVSRGRKPELVAKGIPAQVADRAPGIRVLAKDNAVITVLHDHGRKGRRYRRDRRR